MYKLLIFAVLFFSPYVIFAAELLLISSDERVQVGEAMRVVVGLSPEGTLVNASEAIIKFDPMELKVSSIEIEDSIFDNWIVKPTYDNLQGSITFGGGSTQPFNGGWGSPLMLITFTTLTPGSGTVSITDSTIYAADGLGTKVRHTIDNLTYSILPVTGNGAVTTENAPRIQSQPSAQQQVQHDTGLLTGSIIASIFLLILGLAVGRATVVTAEGLVLSWVPFASAGFGIASIIMFEFSIVPLLAIVCGLLTLKYSDRIGLGLVGVLLGIIFLVVNMAHNLGLA